MGDILKPGWGALQLDPPVPSARIWSHDGGRADSAAEGLGDRATDHLSPGDLEGRRRDSPEGKALEERYSCRKR